MNSKKIYVAMITPFDENNQIDDESVVRLCHHLCKLKVDGIVVAGTTGEAASLSSEERIHLLELVKKTVKDKAEVWMGCGTCNTSTTIQYCLQAEKLKVDGVMLITPYYVKPSQEGLYEHFAKVAESIQTKIMLYNVPKRTGVSLHYKTLIALSERFDHIVAYKQAEYDPEGIRQILSCSSIQLLCGDDLWYDEALEMGMDGIVSVAGHLNTSLLRRMEDYHKMGIHSKKTIETWKNLAKCCFLFSSPSDIKYLLSRKNICHERVRLPLVSLNDEKKQIMDQMMFRTGVLDDSGEML